MTPQERQELYRSRVAVAIRDYNAKLNAWQQTPRGDPPEMQAFAKEGILNDPVLAQMYGKSRGGAPHPAGAPSTAGFTDQSLAQDYAALNRYYEQHMHDELRRRVYYYQFKIRN